MAFLSEDEILKLKKVVDFDYFVDLVLKNPLSGSIVRNIDQLRWEAIPEQLRELVLLHPKADKIISVSDSEKWSAVPMHLYGDMLKRMHSPDLILTNSTLEKWSAIPKKLQIYIIRHPFGFDYLRDFSSKRRTELETNWFSIN